MKSFVPLLTLTLGLTFLAACTDSALVDSPNDVDTASKGKQDKVDVCHLSDTGDFILINVNGNALPAHLAHGDGQPGDPVPGVAGKKFDEACAVVDAGPTVTYGPFAKTSAAGVRFKGQTSGNEIYLGRDLGAAPPARVEAGYTWSAGTYDVTFRFDASLNKVFTTIDGPGGPKSLEYSLTTFACAVSGWNVLDIYIKNGPLSTSAKYLEFNNVYLNGFSLGDFKTVEGGTINNNWKVADFNFGQDFTVSGKLVVDGIWGANEEDKLQLVVGCLP